MYCVKCGNLNAKENIFCGNCGTRLEKREGAYTKRDNIMNGEGLRVSYLETVLVVISLMVLLSGILFLLCIEEITVPIAILARAFSNIKIHQMADVLKLGMVCKNWFALLSTPIRAIVLCNCFFIVVITVLHFLAVWRIFKKAGMAGWKMLIPVYNLFCVIRILFGTKWIRYSILGVVFTAIEIGIVWCLPECIGFLIIIENILVFLLSVILSKHFGHGLGYAIAQIFFFPLFILIYGWGKDSYSAAVRL